MQKSAKCCIDGGSVKLERYKNCNTLINSDKRQRNRGLESKCMVYMCQAWEKRIIGLGINDRWIGS
jgi:hypothetical protein